MPMVALAALVVVPDDALPGNHIRKSVLEGVPGGRNRLTNAPNYHFNERVVSNHNAAPNQRNGLHVGDNTNTRACCPLIQQNQPGWRGEVGKCPCWSCPQPPSPSRQDSSHGIGGSVARICGVLLVLDITTLSSPCTCEPVA